MKMIKNTATTSFSPNNLSHFSPFSRSSSFTAFPSFFASRFSFLAWVSSLPFCFSASSSLLLRECCSMKRVANTLFTNSTSQSWHLDRREKTESVDAQVQSDQTRQNVKHRSEPSHVTFDDILFLLCGEREKVDSLRGVGSVPPYSGWIVDECVNQGGRESER